jgi:Holliday junction resolvase RusA-like endonuclease
MTIKVPRRKVQIEICYPGACISVNHYRGRSAAGGEYVRREARAWQEELMWTIKPLGIERWRIPLEVTCDGVFLDKNHQPDLSNLSKCSLDAIEEVTGINDKNMRWRDGQVSYGEKPLLLITIKEGLI